MEPPLSKYSIIWMLQHSSVSLKKWSSTETPFITSTTGFNYNNFTWNWWCTHSHICNIIIATLNRLYYIVTCKQKGQMRNAKFTCNFICRRQNKFWNTEGQQRLQKISWTGCLCLLNLMRYFDSYLSSSFMNYRFSSGVYFNEII